MFDKLRKLIRTDRTTSPRVNELPAVPVTFDWRSVLSCYQRGSYDNNYPNISIIANQFMTVLPYAVDAEGEKLKEVPAGIAALYSPNREMSGVKFFEALAVMTLVHPEVYLVIWHKDEAGNITSHGRCREEDIVGYAFLEGAQKLPNGQGGFYYQANGDNYEDYEVMTLSYSVNPYSIMSGYSPSLAIKKWASVDDYIVEYQAGNFLNGAVGAGQFVITAKTPEEFNQIVDRLQKAHQGVGKNNNVNYVHRPIDSLTGQPEPAQIEWIPFNVTNKDLSLQDIFNQVNKKLDTAFAVPEEVKGYIKNSNYASASVAEAYLAKFVVRPMLLKIWTQFTHELNRITGGLGYAISYDYEVPKSSDEEKVKAETLRIHLETLKSAVDSGADVKTAVDALGLPEEMANLSLVPTSVSYTSAYTSQASNTDEKAAVPAKKKQFFYDPEDIDPLFREVLEKEMARQIELAVKDENYSDVNTTALAAAMLRAMLPRMAQLGGAQANSGIAMLLRNGFSAPTDFSYAVSDGLKSSYRSYLEKVAESYDSDTSQQIRRILEEADTLNLTKEETTARLRNIMNTDEWRVQRLAASESHRSAGLASLDSMKELQDTSGVKFTKTWRRNPYSNSCPNCIDLDGKTEPLDKSFVSLGGALPDGQVNNFVNIQSADAHPNCHCSLLFGIASDSQKSVTVECPECKYKLFDSKGGDFRNFKCKRCKAHLDICVEAGKSKAVAIDRPDDKETK